MISVKANQKLTAYFESIENEVQRVFLFAQRARAKGFDPSDKVDVKLAKNLAERVVGLISVVAPQIASAGVVERIIELEKQFGTLDWRVAMQIALEIAQERFVKFKDSKEAIEIGVRVGFAYVTVGVVSSPLEGFTSIHIKKRRDGAGEYFAMNFAGPVRNAGGTAAALSVIICDYVRKKLGYAKYDPDEKECQRTYVEIMDYHERVTNLQYVPSKEEAVFMTANCPIEISGDPSESFEVSNYKDLPRVKANRIRSGFCLIHSSCIPLKAPKLWKNISKWIEPMELQDWKFLEEFLHIQKKAKSTSSSKQKTEKKDETKIYPVYTYMADLVGGRPVVSHPLRPGGFRLRYGRSRVSGFSAQAMHPATMHILDDFIAIGTQLKVERPGKATTIVSCDNIDGPTVLLEDDSVVHIDTIEEAKRITKRVKEVLYLGDVLICYGDFFDRAHALMPVGYCEEWWIQELEATLKARKAQNTNDNNSAHNSESQTESSTIIITPPSTATSIAISPLESISLSAKENATIAFEFFKQTSFQYTASEQTTAAMQTLNTSAETFTNPILKLTQKQSPAFLSIKAQAADSLTQSRLLDLFYKPMTTKITLQEALFIAQSTQTPLHPEFTAFWKLLDWQEFDTFLAALATAQLFTADDIKETSTADAPHQNTLHKKLRFIYTPERKIVFEKLAIPHRAPSHEYIVVDQDWSLLILELFGIRQPFEAAMLLDKYRIFSNEKAVSKKHYAEETDDAFAWLNSISPYKQRDKAGIFIGARMGRPEKAKMRKMAGAVYGVPPQEIDVEENGVKKSIIVTEHALKAELRHKYDVYANKDGTTRYDASEAPITHFKAKEIDTPIARLIELGYTHDIRGDALVNAEQVIELFPQDIVIPCCPLSPNEKCDEVFFRAANFIDELLVKLYGVEPFYKLRNKQDLVGQIVFGLAPHTSAATAARIIGFTKSQPLYCHPMLHAAMRRDCDGDETCAFLLMDGFLNFSTQFLPQHRGGTMDAPLVLTSIINPSEVDDMYLNVDTAWKYPLELYEAALQFKKPWEVKIAQTSDVIGTEKQFDGMGFTHDTSDFNHGVLCSAYKTLPSMDEKVQGQMRLAEKIRAVDATDVAQIVIDKHFIRDVMGNLRKFSQQEFRCSKCNTKFRRPPLSGKCTKYGCGSTKILFTISKGSIVKYLDLSINLGKKYGIRAYTRQCLDLLRFRVDGVFGKDKEKQTGLAGFL